MQILLDNISALLIFSAVALAVVATQFNSTQSTIESTISYMSKKQTLELGAMLEQELKLIGEGTPKKIESVVTNADGQTTSFVYWRNTGAGDIKVEYKLVKTDVVSIHGKDVQRYQMKRYENGVLSGGSPPTLRDFRIQTLDASGNVIADPYFTVLIRARIRDTYPIGDPDDMHVGQTLWGITLRPENL